MTPEYRLAVIDGLCAAMRGGFVPFSMFNVELIQNLATRPEDWFTPVERQNMDVVVARMKKYRHDISEALNALEALRKTMEA